MDSFDSFTFLNSLFMVDFRSCLGKPEHSSKVKHNLKLFYLYLFYFFTTLSVLLFCFN